MRTEKSGGGAQDVAPVLNLFSFCARLDKGVCTIRLYHGSPIPIDRW